MTELATFADIPDLAALVNRAFRGETGRRGWTTESDLLEGQRIDAAMLEERLHDTASRILIARENGRLSACVEVRHLDDETAYLGMLTVDPELQAGGLGARVLKSAERYVTDVWRVRRLEMTVLTARPELIAWYERRGYRVTGERRAFPYGNERYGRPLTTTLEFAVLEKSLTP